MIDEARLLNGPEDRRRALLLLLLMGLVLFGAGLGLRDPWPADEPRFALVARQMVDSGQWLFPMRGGELYPDKPPIFMWAIALCYKLVGSLRVAFLLPSLMAGLGTVALAWDAAWRLWDGATAWRAGLLLLLTVQFTLQARTAQIDALVTFFITLGVYGFLRFLLMGGGWGWYFLGWFAAGLGVITKGVGILALFVLIPALWSHRAELRAASWKAWVKGFAGPLALLAAIGLWLVPMWLAVERSGDPAFAAYRDNILFRQTVTRYAEAWHHHAPWWDYLVNVIPGFWLPLSLLLPWLAPRWIRAIREGDRRILLLLGYLVLVLVFFSASSGKRGVYITPATPALALLAAPFLPGLLASKGPRRAWSFLAWGLAAITVLACLALVASPRLQAKLAAQDLAHPWWGLAPLAVAAVATAWVFRRMPLAALAGIFAAAWLALGFGVNPQLNEGRTPETLLRRAEAQVPAEHGLLILAYKEQFLLHARRPVHHLPLRMPKAQQAALAAAWQGSVPDRWVLAPDRTLDGFFRRENAADLGVRHRERWWLLPPGSALPPSQPPEGPLYRFAPKVQE
jgi:4-amino-4-deoxy-L-arabinose transferase-like glycosyltransferase